MKLTSEQRTLRDQWKAVEREGRANDRATRPKAAPKPKMKRNPPPVKASRGRERDKVYLGWVSQLPCAATMARTGREAYGVHVAHVRHSYPHPGWSNPGLQVKPSDWRTLPLAPHEHAAQHAMNEAAYHKALGIYPPDLCAELRAAFPDLEAGKAVIRSLAPRANALSHTD